MDWHTVAKRGRDWEEEGGGGRGRTEHIEERGEGRDTKIRLTYLMRAAEAKDPSCDVHEHSLIAFTHQRFQPNQLIAM